MISIIGGGPSGSYLAYLLAKEGREVRVFEEHKTIGNPVQCTGLVTKYIKELIDVNDDFLVNLIDKIKIVAPNDDFVELKLNEPDFVFDRGKFDEHIANMAMKEGAEFFLGKKFVGFREGKLRFSDATFFRSDYLVGADGPLSSVAKSFGMFDNRKFMTGLQARCRGSFDADKFVVYLGEGYFGWSVPENARISRIGVIASKKNPKGYFDDVLKKENGEIIEYQSGLIPLYQPRIKLQKDNIFLVGDAGTQTKGSTHGGIIQGMIAAKALKDSFLGNGSYDNLWRRELGRDLYFHLKIRERLDRLTNKKLNYLIRLAKQGKIRKILEKYERDFVSKIIFKIIIKEPRFLSLVF